MTDRGAGAFSLTEAQRFVSQLAQTRTAKHRAVGMATEEHFPFLIRPRSTTETKKERVMEALKPP